MVTSLSASSKENMHKIFGHCESRFWAILTGGNEALFITDPILFYGNGRDCANPKKPLRFRTPGTLYRRSRFRIFDFFLQLNNDII